MAEMIQRRSNNNGGMEVDFNKGTVSRKGEQTTQGHYSGEKLNKRKHTQQRHSIAFTATYIS